MTEERPLPGFNWIKFVAILALVLCAMLSVVIALALYIVSQTAASVQRGDVQTANICTVVKAIDPIIVKAHDQTQQALDDGTLARLIAKGDLAPHTLTDAEHNVKTYADAHATLVGLTCR